MKPGKVLWWGSEIRDFDALCEERGWISRESIEDYLVDELPGVPTKLRFEVPTDYWSAIEHPDLDPEDEVDLLELEGMAHYPEWKIDVRLVLRMERGVHGDAEAAPEGEHPGVDWKVKKLQKQYA